MKRINLLLALSCSLLNSGDLAFGESLMPQSSWDNLEYGSDCKRSEQPSKDAFAPACAGNVSKLLEEWFGSYKQLIVTSSTSDERDLQHKTVSCSFQIAAHGIVRDIKVVESSGMNSVDQKAVAMISRANLRKISPPTNRMPFLQGLIAKFQDGKLTTLELNYAGTRKP